MKKLMLNYIIDETKSNLRLYRVEILTPFLGLHESGETMIRMKPDSKHGFYIYGEIFSYKTTIRNCTTCTTFAQSGVNF